MAAAPTVQKVALEVWERVEAAGRLERAEARSFARRLWAAVAEDAVELEYYSPLEDARVLWLQEEILHALMACGVGEDVKARAAFVLGKLVAAPCGKALAAGEEVAR